MSRRGLTRGPALSLVAALLASACGERQAPSAELFPLAAGHVWTYRQQVEMEDGTSETTALVLRTRAPEDFEGKPAFRRHSDDGVDYWLRRDAGGVFRVAMRHELQPEPARDAAPRYVLKEPLAVGTEWPSTTVAYLLKRRQGFPAELRHEPQPIAMRYMIEALDDNVAVPAGRYERCVRVKGDGVLKLFADPTNGWRDLPINTLEWYCPGPGLVKLVRKEPAGSPFITGGQLTLELREWQPP
jgi:hypothetical protein